MQEINPSDPIPQNIKEWYRTDNDHATKWREDAREAYDFVAGRQWSEEERSKLAEQARPVVTFNRTAVVVDAVHGQELGNQREVRYIPREQGDAQANQLLTGAAQWFRDQSYADDEESDAFLDCIVAGMGWTETRLDFEEAHDGKPTVDRIDPFEMCWDYRAKKRNLRDARRIWRERVIPLSEAQELFGDEFTKSDIDARWTTRTEENDPVANEGDGSDATQTVTIVHFQWKERVQLVKVNDPFTGQTAEMTPDEFTTAQERMAAFGMALEGQLINKRVVKQAFLGNVVLKAGDAPCPDQFSLQCMTGKRDRNKNQFYGVVRPMIDPQRWANKWLSQLMHIMNSNAKGGLLAPRGAFEDANEAEETWSSPDAITYLKDESSADQVKFKPQAALPTGFQQLTEFAISSIRDTSGISVEMLGMREANQAASLEMQRRQAGMTIMQPMFKALEHYRELQGRVVLHYLQNDMADGRLIRLAEKGKEQYVQLAKQADVEFDIIVDDAPTSPNQKEAAWALLMQVMPVLGNQMPPQVIMSLLEYSPLPTSVVEGIQEQINQMQQQQAPAQQAQMAMAQQKHQVDTAKTVSETQENQADAAYTAAKAQKEGAEAAMMMQQLMRPPIPIQ